MRHLSRTMYAIAAAAFCAAACAGSSLFPASILFEQATLSRVTTWSRGEMSGAVYVRPGQELPAAPLQVGAIMSNAHTTAAALHSWVRDEVMRSGAMHFHESNLAEESCRVARTENRTYLALEVCKTGVARAICVEADETIDMGAVTSCLNDSGGCFTDLCDTKWLARREALDALAVELLKRR